MIKKKNSNIKSRESDKIKLKEEKLDVGKKKIETGRVKISKKVLKEEVPIDLEGYVEDVEIRRKQINRVVQDPGPAVREEGGATVYSLYKEVYVKQLILTEEVWISKKTTKKSLRGKPKLRREILEVDRAPVNPDQMK